MSSSTDQAVDPPPPGDGGPGMGAAAAPDAPDLAAAVPPQAASPENIRPAGDAGPPETTLPGTGYASAALVSGMFGFFLITIFTTMVFGVLGLRRASRTGQGKVRCWLGIALAIGWATAAGCLAPRLIQAADPGCVAYKGTGLTAYNRVVADFSSGAGRARVTGDLDTAIRQLDMARSASRNAAAARSLADLSAGLRTVVTDIQLGEPVPRAVLEALNQASSLADKACGTVKL